MNLKTTTYCGLLLAATLGLTACGKVGGLDRPAGDWDYPQQYPYPPSVVPEGGGTAPSATDENPMPNSIRLRNDDSRTETKTYGE